MCLLPPTPRQLRALLSIQQGKGGVVQDARTKYVHVADHQEIVKLLLAPDLVPTRDLDQLLSLNIDLDIRDFVASVMTAHIGNDYRQIRKDSMSPFAKTLIDGHSEAIRRDIDEQLKQVAFHIPFDGPRDISIPIMRKVLLGSILGLQSDQHASLILKSRVLADSLQKLGNTPTAGPALEYTKRSLERFARAVDMALSSQCAGTLWSNHSVWNRRYGLLYGILTSLESAAAGMISNLLWSYAVQQAYDRIACPFQGRMFAIETLRMLPPSGVVHRITTRERPIGHIIVPAGTSVWLWLWRANLDKDVFTNPSDFLEFSDRRKSLSFGAGVYSCPFAPLMLTIGQSLLESIESSGLVLRGISEPHWSDIVFGFRPARLPLIVSGREPR